MPERANLGASILFGEAKARVDEISRLITEYNEIAETLRGLGYGRFPATPDESTAAYLPALLLSSTNQDFPDSSFLDEVWQDGPAEAGNLGPTSRRSAAVASERRRLGIAGGWICFYCRLSGDEERGPDNRLWHVDHVYPVSKGGDNWPDNHVLACATCNLQKSAQSAVEYFGRRLVSIAGGVA